MPSLNAEVERRLLNEGASLVGFADVSGLPASLTGGSPRAVCIAVQLDPTIVREIANGPTPRYFAEYNRINALLAQLSDRAATILAGAGYRANPVQSTTEQFNPVTLSMPVPVSYTHLRAHETVLDLVCRLLLEKKTLTN